MIPGTTGFLLGILYVLHWRYKRYMEWWSEEVVWVSFFYLTVTTCTKKRNLPPDSNLFKQQVGPVSLFPLCLFGCIQVFLYPLTIEFICSLQSLYMAVSISGNVYQVQGDFVKDLSNSADVCNYANIFCFFFTETFNLIWYVDNLPVH